MNDETPFYKGQPACRAVFRAPPPRRASVVLGRARTCQFPLNDGKPWVFCDYPAVLRGSSYCEAHHTVCYRQGSAVAGETEVT
jgi:hypothetical protein